MICNACHGAIDQGSRMSREERVDLWESAHRATIEWLFTSGRLKVCEVVDG